LALNGWILAGIVSLLAVTAWITVFQRISFVYRTTTSPGE
jgi:CDP-diacylglycerol--glycerol-3-phosphate 3-phosphatidyltransferase